MAREMKNSGVRWIGDIPKNWAMTKIKFEISDYKAGPFGSSLITDKLEQEGNILVYTPEHVALSSDTCSNNLYLPEARRFEMSQFFVKEGDIVFPIVGSLGRAMKINSNNNEGIINQRLAKFRLSSTRLKDDYFLWLFARSSFYSPYIDLYRRGTIILNLTKTIVGGMPIPLPPLSEQKVIADFLDAKCGEIDGLLADLDAEVKTLTEYKKSLIAEKVTRGLNPNAPMKSSGIPWADTIPAHWEIDKGKFRFELRRTKGNPRNLELMSPTQKYGVIPQSQLEGVVLVKENTDLNAFRTICIGDFCISLRSFQGGFEYSNYEGVVSPAYQVFYPIKPIADGYFKFVFKSDGFISYINTFSMSLRDGKNIAFEDFGNSSIPIPPLDEQIAIANYLDSKCAAIEQSITDKTQQIETLKSYKSSLIYEYVTGKKQVL